MTLLITIILLALLLPVIATGLVYCFIRFIAYVESNWKRWWNNIFTW